MGTQVEFTACKTDWPTERKPGMRPELVPDYYGHFTPVESQRPSDWCKWSETGRRYDARILRTKPSQSYGSGTPSLNSYKVCKVSGTGTGTHDSYLTVQTPEGSVNLPRQGVEQVSNHYMPSCEQIHNISITADTRLQAAPLRYFK